MTLSKREATQLADDIRSAKVAGHAIAARAGHPHLSEAAFLGGLEAVLCHFLRGQGRDDVSAALIAAMNHVPTADEIAARSAQISRLGKAAA